MKMINRLSKIQFLVFLSSTVLILSSCGKETQSSTQGGGTFRVRATFTPPVKCGMDSTSFRYNYAQLAFMNVVLWQGMNETKDLSELSTQEFAVTKGQNALASISLNNLKDKNCNTVKVEGIQNGKVIKTVIYEIGDVACKDKTGQTINFIIE